MRKLIICTIAIVGLIVLQNLHAGEGISVSSCKLGIFGCAAGTKQHDGVGNDPYIRIPIGLSYNECGLFFGTISCGHLAVPDKKE